MTGIEYSAMNAICDIAKIKKNDPNYWTRLEHQYAGMAMQGILANKDIDVLILSNEEISFIANRTIELATALVEKLKEKEERK